MDRLPHYVVSKDCINSPMILRVYHLDELVDRTPSLVGHIALRQRDGARLHRNGLKHSVAERYHK